MSRSCNGTTQYLSNANAVLDSNPTSMAVWFYALSAKNGSVCSLFDSIDNDNRHIYVLSSGHVYASVQGSGGVLQAIASTTFSTGSWNHGVAVFNSATDRRVYLNGGSKGTNTDDEGTLTGLDTTYIARSAGLAASFFFHGYVADVAFWNIALTDADAAALAAGVSPLKVRRSGLRSYWRLLGANSPEPDYVGGYDLSLTAAPTNPASHPAVIIPGLTTAVVSGTPNGGPVGASRFPASLLGI